MITALAIEGLNVRYQAQRVLNEVSLTLPSGALAAVVGPNGAGKTTLLNAIVELIPKETGSVNIFSGPFREKRSLVAYMPQRSQVDWDFPIKVIDVVLMGKISTLMWWQRPSKSDKKAAYEALEKVDLASYAETTISELSGGQQQRMFIARALLQKASLYLLDEPFSAVDAASEHAIFEQLKSLQQQGATILCVHHDLSTLTTYFDHTVLLNRHVIAFGKTEDTFTQDKVNKTYNNSLSLFNEVTAKL